MTDSHSVKTLNNEWCADDGRRRARPKVAIGTPTRLTKQTRDEPSRRNSYRATARELNAAKKTRRAPEIARTPTLACERQRELRQRTFIREIKAKEIHDTQGRTSLQDAQRRRWSERVARTIAALTDWRRRHPRIVTLLRAVRETPEPQVVKGNDLSSIEVRRCQAAIGLIGRTSKNDVTSATGFRDSRKCHARPQRESHERKPQQRTPQWCAEGQGC